MLVWELAGKHPVCCEQFQTSWGQRRWETNTPTPKADSSQFSWIGRSPLSSAASVQYPVQWNESACHLFLLLMLSEKCNSLSSSGKSLFLLFPKLNPLRIHVLWKKSTNWRFPSYVSVNNRGNDCYFPEKKMWNKFSEIKWAWRGLRKAIPERLQVILYTALLIACLLDKLLQRKMSEERKWAEDWDWYVHIWKKTVTVEKQHASLLSNM